MPEFIPQNFDICMWTGFQIWQLNIKQIKFQQKIHSKFDPDTLSPRPKDDSLEDSTHIPSLNGKMHQQSVMAL